MVRTGLVTVHKLSKGGPPWALFVSAWVMTFKSCCCKREPDPRDNNTLIKEGSHTPSHSDQGAHLTLHNLKNSHISERKETMDALKTEDGNSIKCCKMWHSVLNYYSEWETGNEIDCRIQLSKEKHRLNQFNYHDDFYHNCLVLFWNFSTHTFTTKVNNIKKKQWNNKHFLYALTWFK